VREVEWLELAKLDLLAIIEYISNDNPDAALCFKNEIESKIQHLMLFPQIGRQGRVKNTREFVISDNYILVYQEVMKSIRIVRVLHSARLWP
jgi:addiction module RelE/StbE family toxin